MACGFALRADLSAMLGFVNLFKPAGPSSTQFGARLRRIYRDPPGKLAVGHLGTLDPQAAGVLPIALGKATRLLPLIADRRKGYVCTLVLGRATATADGPATTSRSVTFRPTSMRGWRTRFRRSSAP